MSETLQVAESVSPQVVKEQLDALAVILGGLAKLADQKVLTFLVDMFVSYKDQEWFLAMLMFVLNRFTGDESPTVEELQKAVVEFSNK